MLLNWNYLPVRITADDCVSGFIRCVPMVTTSQWMFGGSINSTQTSMLTDVSSVTPTPTLMTDWHLIKWHYSVTCQHMMTISLWGLNISYHVYSSVNSFRAVKLSWDVTTTFEALRQLTLQGLCAAVNRSRQLGGWRGQCILSNKVDITFAADFYYFYDYYSAQRQKNYRAMKEKYTKGPFHQTLIGG